MRITYFCVITMLLVLTLHKLRRTLLMMGSTLDDMRIMHRCACSDVHPACRAGVGLKVRLLGGSCWMHFPSLEQRFACICVAPVGFFDQRREREAKSCLM